MVNVNNVIHLQNSNRSVKFSNLAVNIVDVTSNNRPEIIKKVNVIPNLYPCVLITVIINTNGVVVVVQQCITVLHTCRFLEIVRHNNKTVVTQVVSVNAVNRYKILVTLNKFSFSFH